MRGLLIAAALLAVPSALASEPYEVVLDWHEDRFLASTRLGIEHVDRWSDGFTLDACHRTMTLDLLYDPSELLVDAPGGGEAALVYSFRAEIWSGEGDAMTAQRRIRASAYDHPLGTAPEAGPYELRLFLTTGADVEWSARLRASETYEESACQ